MSRRRNPLPQLTDRQVLKSAALVLTLQAKDPANVKAASDLLRDMACRLRRLARRVPLWTGRAWQPETPSPYDLSER